MKWSVVGLVFLGVLAAISAAVLVGALRADPWRGGGKGVESNPEITIVVATRTLPPMTILDASMLKTVSKPRDQAPPKAITDITQAAGKVLAMQVASGEPLTLAAFAPEGGGKQLAAQLQEHSRGMEITVADASGLVGKLYPGCIVDVLVAIRKQAAGDETPATISRPLLQRVEVMAVDQRTVVAPDVDKKEDNAMRQSLHKVMLNVDEREAQMLQLAQEVGTLYLLLRNPTDTAPADPTAVTLATLLGPGMQPETAPAPATQGVAIAPPAPPLFGGPPATTAAAPPKPIPTWTIKVIHNDKTDTQTFAAPPEE